MRERDAFGALSDVLVSGARAAQAVSDQRASQKDAGTQDTLRARAIVQNAAIPPSSDPPVAPIAGASAGEPHPAVSSQPAASSQRSVAAAASSQVPTSVTIVAGLGRSLDDVINRITTPRYESEDIVGKLLDRATHPTDSELLNWLRAQADSLQVNPTPASVASGWTFELTELCVVRLIDGPFLAAFNALPRPQRKKSVLLARLIADDIFKAREMASTCSPDSWRVSQAAWTVVSKGLISLPSESQVDYRLQNVRRECNLLYGGTGNTADLLFGHPIKERIDRVREGLKRVSSVLNPPKAAGSTLEGGAASQGPPLSQTAQIIERRRVLREDAATAAARVAAKKRQHVDKNTVVAGEMLRIANSTL